MPRESIGVGIANDRDGRKQVWVAARNGFALAADRDTGEIILSSKDLGDVYTYSDFTGFVLRTFTSPLGSYRAVLEGCAGTTLTQWLELTWDATLPAETELTFFVRSSASLAELGDPSTQRFGPFGASPVDLQAAGVPENRYLEIEAVFKSLDGLASPALKAMNVSYKCFGELN
jgi:hypothetical protein